MNYMFLLDFSVIFFIFYISPQKNLTISAKFKLKIWIQMILLRGGYTILDLKKCLNFYILERHFKSECFLKDRQYTTESSFEFI